MHSKTLQEKALGVQTVDNANRHSRDHTLQQRSLECQYSIRKEKDKNALPQYERTGSKTPHSRTDASTPHEEEIHTRSLPLHIAFLTEDCEYDPFPFHIVRFYNLSSPTKRKQCHSS